MISAFGEHMLARVNVAKMGGFEVVRIEVTFLLLIYVILMQLLFQ